jgi:CheY-like chemotaxis protein
MSQRLTQVLRLSFPDFVINHPAGLYEEISRALDYIDSIQQESEIVAAVIDVSLSSEREEGISLLGLLRTVKRLLFPMIMTCRYFDPLLEAKIRHYKAIGPIDVTLRSGEEKLVDNLLSELEKGDVFEQLQIFDKVFLTSAAETDQILIVHESTDFIQSLACALPEPFKNTCAVCSFEEALEHCKLNNRYKAIIIDAEIGKGMRIEQKGLDLLREFRQNLLTDPIIVIGMNKEDAYLRNPRNWILRESGHYFLQVPFLVSKVDEKQKTLVDIIENSQTVTSFDKVLPFLIKSDVVGALQYVVNRLIGILKNGIEESKIDIFRKEFMLFGEIRSSLMSDAEIKTVLKKIEQQLISLDNTKEAISKTQKELEAINKDLQGKITLHQRYALRGKLELDEVSKRIDQLEKDQKAQDNKYRDLLKSKENAVTDACGLLKQLSNLIPSACSRYIFQQVREEVWHDYPSSSGTQGSVDFVNSYYGSCICTLRTFLADPSEDNYNLAVNGLSHLWWDKLAYYLDEKLNKLIAPLERYGLSEPRLLSQVFINLKQFAEEQEKLRAAKINTERQRIAADAIHLIEEINMLLDQLLRDERKDERSETISGQSIKVLVVDDDAKKWEDALAEYLKRYFYVITPFEEDPVDYKQRIDQEHPDVIILDLYYRNSKQTGRELLRKIKEEYPEIQVILITMYDDPSIGSECGRLGAVNYFVKQRDNLSKLVGMINSAIKHNKTDILLYRRIAALKNCLEKDDIELLRNSVKDRYNSPNMTVFQSYLALESACAKEGILIKFYMDKCADLRHRAAHNNPKSDFVQYFPEDALLTLCATLRSIEAVKNILNSLGIEIMRQELPMIRSKLHSFLDRASLSFCKRDLGNLDILLDGLNYSPNAKVKFIEDLNHISECINRNLYARVCHDKPLPTSMINPDDIINQFIDRESENGLRIEKPHKGSE